MKNAFPRATLALLYLRSQVITKPLQNSFSVAFLFQRSTGCCQLCGQTFILCQQRIIIFLRSLNFCLHCSRCCFIGCLALLQLLNLRLQVFSPGLKLLNIICRFLFYLCALLFLFRELTMGQRSLRCLMPRSPISPAFCFVQAPQAHPQALR